MKNTAKILLFIFLPIVLALAGGAVWGLVDWLRSYGSNISPFPYFDHLQSNLELHPRYQANTFFGIIENVINWYNMTFRGGTRFGSGVGFMAGAFVVMGYYKEQNVFARLVAGTIAGAEIGARFALNLGSGVPLFLVGTTLGAVVGALYMSSFAAPAKYKTLPTKELSRV